MEASSVPVNWSLRWRWLGWSFWGEIFDVTEDLVDSTEQNIIGWVFHVASGPTVQAVETQGHLLLFQLPADQFGQFALLAQG
jgi:hypothetical protein